MVQYKVYYWPFMIRGASLVRMLEHTNTPYEYISEKPKMAIVSSAWGAQVDTIAPPVLVDGDFAVSQSVASCLYLGNKLGLTPPGYNEYKAMQYCLDIIDVFEGGIGKNNEEGATLKKYLEGDRFKTLMANLERSIKGPFYFGDTPSAVDFFLVQHMDWRCLSIFEPLKAKGIDFLTPYPKLVGVHEAIKATDAYKNFDKVPLPGPLKDDILCVFG